MKLESILDKEAEITHDMFAAQIEARLGSGEGSSAKGPDMKVWSKGKGLDNVCATNYFCHVSSHLLIRSISNWLNSVIRQLSYPARA